MMLFKLLFYKNKKSRTAESWLGTGLFCGLQFGAKGRSLKGSVPSPSPPRGFSPATRIPHRIIPVGPTAKKQKAGMNPTFYFWLRRQDLNL